MLTIFSLFSGLPLLGFVIPKPETRQLESIANMLKKDAGKVGSTATAAVGTVAAAAGGPGQVISPVKSLTVKSSFFCNFFFEVICCGLHTKTWY